MQTRLQTKDLRKAVDVKSTLLDLAIKDCYGRFILNVPQQYLSNQFHLCFAIQEAYWWYDDYWHDACAELLPKLSMKRFGILLCRNCPLLKMYFKAHDYEAFIAQWRAYCKTIPLKGAILVNNTLTKVLMVRAWQGGHWMFPRGKVDELETDVACAVREVKEELGVDISGVIRPNMYIETTRGEQSIKLYVIPGILESTHFEPRKRKEIGEIQWIPVHLIPGWARFSKNCNSLLGLSTAETSSFSQNAGGVEHFSRTKDCTGHSQMRFWNVYPFAESLVGWMHLVKLSLKPNNVSRFLPSSVTTTPQLESQEQRASSNTPKHTAWHDCVTQHQCNAQLIGDATQHNSLLSYDAPVLLPKNSVLPKPCGHQTSLCLLQLNSVKPEPVPPLVDPAYSFSLPVDVAPEIIQRLQQPVAHRRQSTASTRTPPALFVPHKSSAPRQSLLTSHDHRASTTIDNQMPTFVSSPKYKNHSETVKQRPCDAGLGQLDTSSVTSSSVEPFSLNGSPTAERSKAKTKLETCNVMKHRSILDDLRQWGVQLGDLHLNVENSDVKTLRSSSKSSKSSACYSSNPVTPLPSLRLSDLQPYEVSPESPCGTMSFQKQPFRLSQGDPVKSETCLPPTNAASPYAAAPHVQTTFCSAATSRKEPHRQPISLLAPRHQSRPTKLCQCSSSNLKSDALSLTLAERVSVTSYNDSSRMSHVGYPCSRLEYFDSQSFGCCNTYQSFYACSSCACYSPSCCFSNNHWMMSCIKSCSCAFCPKCSCCYMPPT